MGIVYKFDVLKIKLQEMLEVILVGYKISLEIHTSTVYIIVFSEYSYFSRKSVFFSFLQKKT